MLVLRQAVAAPWMQINGITADTTQGVKIAFGRTHVDAAQIISALQRHAGRYCSGVLVGFYTVAIFASARRRQA